MANCLIRKLQRSGYLNDEDIETIERLCSRTREVDPRQDLTREGDRPENVHLILEGLACRYKLTHTGQRHIMALLVPGDLCDLHVALLRQMDHSVATVTNCTVVEIPRATVLDLTENHPRLTRALWWAMLVDEGILREWLVNLGQREADLRLAHLLCELLVRLQTVGVATENSYPMPLTQADLGDVLGISTVHVNRTVNSLRDAELIVLKHRRVEIPDVDRLKAYCGFNPNYLHLTPRPAASES